MPSPEQALAKAARAQARARAATEAFHQSIKDAHAAGCTTRQIAARVGLSHQRVHQITRGLSGNEGKRR